MKTLAIRLEDEQHARLTILSKLGAVGHGHHPAAIDAHLAKLAADPELSAKAEGSRPPSTAKRPSSETPSLRCSGPPSRPTARPPRAEPSLRRGVRSSRSNGPLAPPQTNLKQASCISRKGFPRRNSTTIRAAFMQRLAYNEYRTGIEQNDRHEQPNQSIYFSLATQGIGLSPRSRPTRRHRRLQHPSIEHGAICQPRPDVLKAIADAWAWTWPTSTPQRATSSRRVAELRALPAQQVRRPAGQRHTRTRTASPASPPSTATTRRPEPRRRRNQ